MARVEADSTPIVAEWNSRNLVDIKYAKHYKYKMT